MGQQLDMLDWLQATAPIAAAAELVVLYRVDPVKNMHRFYALRIERTLFGDWALVRRWGRIGAHRGQMQSNLFASLEAAALAMERQARTKALRGYH